MSIIIEGPDHVGKTTAAKLLADSTGMRIIHAGVKPDSYNHLTGRMRDLVPEHAIHDRFHLSGFVYGHLCAMHPEDITPARMRVLMKWLRFMNVPVVIMFDGDQVEYKSRMAEKPKEETFGMNVRLIVNEIYGFLSRYTLMGLPFCDIAWDISKKGFPTEEDLLRWTTISPLMNQSER